MSAGWRSLGRYHALVAINARLTQNELHERHDSVLAVLEPLIERGQEARVFRADVPAAWRLSVVLALVHAAGSELSAGRVAEDETEHALLASVRGAVAAAAAA